MIIRRKWLCIVSCYLLAYLVFRTNVYLLVLKLKVQFETAPPATKVENKIYYA